MTESHTPGDPFELIRRLWGSAGIPVPGMAMPTLDPQEVEKRVAELRALDGWLSANLNMVKLAIQGLEMQKAALLAMRAAGDATKPASGPDTARSGDPQAGNPQANPLLWPWFAMQQAAEGRAAADTTGAAASAAPGPDKPDRNRT
ncbi:MAG: hypothetical protein OEW21_01580 [Betaproteobacteria bacterium]|nr:hypothetical protein [Betaproteobacteria bacterium]